MTTEKDIDENLEAKLKATLQDIVEHPSQDKGLKYNL